MAVRPACLDFRSARFAIWSDALATASRETALDLWIHTALVGIGATACVDAWSLLRKRWLGIPAPDFGLVGRWMAGFARGRFVHPKLAASPAIAGERILGWGAHYLIGISFAVLLPWLWGPEWLGQPRLGPALTVGVVTVLAPWLLMHPGMGAGLFGWRTAKPWPLRLHNLITHTLFGLGLYLSARGLVLLVHP